MAKVTGPLMSMDASGKFAGALVFGKWKGRPTVRQLVTPANPQTTGQQASRNAVRAMGAIQFVLNRTTQKRAGETVTDKVELTAAAPAGQAWNGFLVKSGVGAGGANYLAANAAYAALTAPQKTAWDTAAAAMVPAMPAVVQKAAGGVPATSLTSGNVHFIGQYALNKAGLTLTAPGAVPPVYA